MSPIDINKPRFKPQTPSIITKEQEMASVEKHPAGGKTPLTRPLLGKRFTCGYLRPEAVLTRNDEKRLQAVQEILRTEKKYVKCLETLKVVFKDRISAQNLLPRKEIGIIFPQGLESIHDAHARMESKLDMIVSEQWSLQSVVGSVFIEMFSSSTEKDNLVQHYSHYCNNFSRAVALVKRHSRHSQKFQTFLENCAEDPICDGLDLSAFLLTPIQRLPRYVLLLQQVLKHTDITHVDRPHLELALSVVTQAVDRLNCSIARYAASTTNSLPRKRTTERKRAGSFKNKEIEIIPRLAPYQSALPRDEDGRTRSYSCMVFNRETRLVEHSDTMLGDRTKSLMEITGVEGSSKSHSVINEDREDGFINQRVHPTSNKDLLHDTLSKNLHEKTSTESTTQELRDSICYHRCKDQFSRDFITSKDNSDSNKPCCGRSERKGSTTGSLTKVGLTCGSGHCGTGCTFNPKKLHGFGDIMRTFWYFSRNMVKTLKEPNRSGAMYNSGFKALLGLSKRPCDTTLHRSSSTEILEMMVSSV